MAVYEVKLTTQEKWEETYLLRGRNRAEIEAQIPNLACDHPYLDDRYELERKIVSCRIKQKRRRLKAR